MAQERKKRRIVLASILKPVGDTRMLEKIGGSLLKAGHDVTIIGYPTDPIPASPVHNILLTPFRRLSLRRLLAKWEVFRHLGKVRPEIVIFCTHELLLPCVLAKILWRTYIIYDVRENYLRNILLSRSFPWIVRLPLACLVRLKEVVLSPFVDQFFLAEKGYDKEFGFHRPRSFALENKVAAPIGPRIRKFEGTSLLFSGTLAESTGVFTAIEFATGMHDRDPSVRLTLAGHTARETELRRIRLAIRDKPFITLVGGDRLVPHREILELIRISDAGLLCYPISLHIKNSRPTKLYEYLAARLPIVLEPHWPWIMEFELCNPFVATDFSKPDFGGILKKLRSDNFYTETPPGIYWESEERKLLAFIENL